MRVLLTGGGTGGHIYPALALYREIMKQYPESQCLYVGTEKGMESELVPSEGIPFTSIDIQGFKRSLSLDTVKTLSKFLTSVQKSKKILKEFKPDIVIGTGGYVCGPVIYAAHRLSIPTIIHEQNSKAGLTNRFLARFVDKIAICFEDVRADFGSYQHKLVLTGNPRAQEVVQIPYRPILEDYGLESERPTVLMFGGSRGALKINEAFHASYPELKEKDYQTLFVSGELYFEEFKKNQPLAYADNQKVQVVPYVNNMPEVLMNTDLVISRAGATTIAELTALGKPSILIPSPNVTADHQTKNARALSDHGAALLLAEGDLDAENLLREIDDLMENTSKREAMARASKELGIPDASQRLLDLILDLIQ